jgi:capsular exopolysaccharide synthesis family protein
LLEIEYNRLHREKVNTEKLYSLVLERTKESDLTRAARFNNLRIIDEPRAPRAPVRPRLPISLLIGGFAGLALGLALALGRELLDRTVKLPEHVEGDVGLTFLGLIPANGGSVGKSPPYYGRRRRRRLQSGENAAPELIVHSESTSGIAEAARAIRTNILFMAPDEPYRRLLVTSAGPGEGKTTVACCIAIAMAQAGQRVLLVDCDLRRPRLHRIFQRANDIGVSSALLDMSVLDGARLETEVPNLSLLPSGPHVPNPAEVLQSDSFARLLEALGQRYDRLVIDSPPVAPVTDAAVLSRRVDATVMVIRAFRTTRDLARRAKRSLSDVGARIVGAVLNAVDLDRRDYGYQQYYYYHRDGYAGNQVKVHEAATTEDEARRAS